MYDRPLNVVPTAVCDLMIKVYNDSIFATTKEDPKACMHFSVRLAIESKLVDRS